MKRRSQFPPEPAGEYPTEETPAVPVAPGPPAGLDPDAVAAQRFGVTRRGYDPASVQEFLGRAAAELRRLAASAESARSEASQLRRHVEDLEATGRPPDRVEALAVLGDETNRVLSAAQASAAEIISAAETAAGEIKARAREEAEQLSSEVREYAESAARRTSEQADEVRERLREEVRRARRDVAEEAAALHAEAKAQADELRASAREEAARVRAEAEDATSTHRRDIEERTKLVVMEAEREAEEILGAARIRIGRLEAEADAARTRLLADVERRRVAAEAHVRAFEDVRARLAGEFAGARTLLAGLLGELESVSLGPVELPPLTALAGVLDLPPGPQAGTEVPEEAPPAAGGAAGSDVEAPGVRPAALEGPGEAAAEDVLQPEDLGPELAEAPAAPSAADAGPERAPLPIPVPGPASSEAGESESLPASVGDEVTPAPGAAPVAVPAAEGETGAGAVTVSEAWGELDAVPDDDEVEELFARVLAVRGTDDVAAAPEAAEDAEGAAEAEWGYMEDVAPVAAVVPGGVTSVPEEPTVPEPSGTPESRESWDAWETGGVEAFPDSWETGAAGEPADAGAWPAPPASDANGEPQPGAGPPREVPERPGDDRRRRLRQAFSLLETSSSNGDLSLRGDGPVSTVGAGEDAALLDLTVVDDLPVSREAGAEDAAEPGGVEPAGRAEPAAPAEASASETVEDDVATAVAVVARRLKRALQDDENVLLDATRDGEAPEPSDDTGRIELLVEYLQDGIGDAVALGAGDVEVDVDVPALIADICGPWVARLGAELDGLSHADAVSAAYRIFRAEAGDAAGDLVRAAYEAGRRAASSASGSVTGA